MAWMTDKMALYHLPRTGGSWLQHRSAHLGVPWREQGFAHDWPGTTPAGSRTVVTVLRHPFSWLPSYFRMLKKSVFWASPMQPMLMFPGCSLASFPEFIGDLVRHRSGTLTNIYQLWGSPADLIGTTDNLMDLLEAVLLGHGIRLTNFGDSARESVARPWNVTGPSKIPCEWSVGMQERLVESENALFKEFRFSTTEAVSCV